MAAFLSSQYYKSLPGIAIALDEGLASEGDDYKVFYGERLPWWIEVTSSGNTGHGSRFIEPTAVSQIVKLAQKALAFREGQKDLLFGKGKHAGCSHAVASKKTLGDVTSLNITTLEAGVSNGDGTFAKNCVPPKAMATLDIRISPNIDPAEIKSELNLWCQECSEDGGGITWDYVGHGNDYQKHATTSTDPDENPWYARFVDGVKLSGIDVTPQVFPAATDSRFLRALGIKALGFSPIRNSEILLHEYDENLKVDVYLEGVEVYLKLIPVLASA